MKYLVLTALWVGMIGLAVAESPTDLPRSHLINTAGGRDPSPGRAQDRSGLTDETASKVEDSQTPTHLAWRPSPAEGKLLTIEDSGPGFINLLQALAFCGVVACAGVYITRRYGRTRGGTSARRLRLVERTALSSKTSLVLVELDGRPFLISLGQERASITPVDDFQSLNVEVEGGDECRKVIGFPA